MHNYSLTKAAPGKLARARRKGLSLLGTILVTAALFTFWVVFGYEAPKVLAWCASIARRWPLLLALLVLSSCAASKPTPQTHNPKPKSLGWHGSDARNERSR